MIIQEIIDDMVIRTYSDKGVYIYGGNPKGNWVSDIDNNIWEPSVYGWSEVI